MSPDAQLLYDFISNKDLANNKTFISTIKKIDKKVDLILEVFRETLLNNNVSFNSLFAMNFIDSEKLNIVSSILKIDKDKIVLSPQKDEVIRFTIVNETYEILANIYNTCNRVCGTSIEEFVASYLILLTEGAFVKIFMCKKHNPDNLIEAIRKIYIKSKEEKDVKRNS